MPFPQDFVFETLYLPAVRPLEGSWPPRGRRWLVAVSGERRALHPAGVRLFSLIRGDRTGAQASGGGPDSSRTCHLAVARHRATARLDPPSSVRCERA